MSRPFPTRTYELAILQRGYSFVVGVDEAGRGPWAGPVTAGALLVDLHTPQHPLVRDSKYMSAEARNEAFQYLQNTSLSFGISIVSSSEIDKRGIQNAVQQAMEEAVHQAIDSHSKATIKNTFILVDGSKTNTLSSPLQSEKILRGGALHYAISAGSILAKVTRDRIMTARDITYPEYGFGKHMGYGTKQHQEALAKWGPCPIHRFSYHPVARYLKDDSATIHIRKNAKTKAAQ